MTSLVNPEGVKALAGLISALAWPAVVLVALAWFWPQVTTTVGRVTEFTLFGLKAKLKAAEEEAAKEVEPTPAPPTPRQLKRAAEVNQAVTDAPDFVRSQIDRLAEEYETVRASLGPGPDRTRQMERVAAKMRTIGLAAYRFRYDLSGSPSPGRRLQAVASLEMNGF